MLRAGQRLVGAHGHAVGALAERVLEPPRADQACHVGGVVVHVGPQGVGDLGDLTYGLREQDLGGAEHDQLGLVLLDPPDGPVDIYVELLVVERDVLHPQAVDGPRGPADPGPLLPVEGTHAYVATFRDGEGHHHVSRLSEGRVHGKVRHHAADRSDVRVLDPEDVLHQVHGQLLHLVDVPAARVDALAHPALRVPVAEVRQ